MIAFAPEFDPAAWLAFAASLHPAVLHVPIGLWFGVAALEFGSALLSRPSPRGSVAALAWLAALGSGAAAASGWLLGAEGGYDADKLQLHRWLGVSLAACGLFAALFAAQRPRASFRLLLLVVLGLMLPAGHVGGELTHGSSFLRLPRNRPADEASPAAVGAASYEAAVAPLFERTCTKCHGADKQKGDLQLHERAGIAAGGEFGPVVVAGQPQESEVLRRCLLPIDDEDHMPPEGKPQPTAAELEVLRAWIAAGAPFEGAFAAGPGVRRDSPEQVPEREAPAPLPAAPALSAADDAALQALRERLVFVETIAGTAGLLHIDVAAAAATFTDELAAALLTPLAPRIVDLTLARAPISDAAVALCVRMPRLRRLDLRATAVTSDGVAALADHAALRELVLAQTAVDDRAVPSLQGMPGLARLYVWRSALSPGAVASLRTRVTLHVDAGDAPVAEALETEGELRFADELPPPGQDPIAAAVRAALLPTNELCPVTGEPVDARYAIVHDGKVIGFCCPNCVVEFWARRR